jgi:hypothetical protein
MHDARHGNWAVGRNFHSRQIKPGFAREIEQFRHGEAIDGDWGGIDDAGVGVRPFQGHGQLVQGNGAAIVCDIWVKEHAINRFVGRRRSQDASQVNNAHQKTDPCEASHHGVDGQFHVYAVD